MAARLVRMNVDAQTANFLRPAFARREAQHQFAGQRIDERQKRARAADGFHRFFERGFEQFIGFGQRSLRQFDVELVEDGTQRRAKRRRKSCRVPVWCAKANCR